MDPMLPAGLPFPVRVLEFKACCDSGQFSQQFSRSFPGTFLQNSRKDPRNSHSLLEFSDLRARILKHKKKILFCNPARPSGPGGARRSLQRVSRAFRGPKSARNSLETVSETVSKQSIAPKVGRTPRGSCNRTLLRRVLRRFSSSRCFLEGFLEGAWQGLQ